MTFNLELQCTNAAFGNTDEERALEIARILKIAMIAVRAAPSIGNTAAILRDANGNVVGSWRLA
jgi:ADP-heptose:LPS heptosyltransferase